MAGFVFENDRVE